MGGVSKLVSCVLQERFISFSWVKDVSWLWHGRITIVSGFLREHFNGALAVFNWFEGCFYCAFFGIFLHFARMSNMNWRAARAEVRARLKSARQ